MIFAGCSFTWGQGLYYYSGMPTITEPPPDKYIDSLVTDAHREVLKVLRYPRTVANHFKSFELVQPWNGGTVERSIAWWKASLDPYESKVDSNNVPKISPDEISHLVFQLTHWTRNPFTYTYKNVTTTNSYAYLMHESSIFVDWLKVNNLTMEQFIQRSVKEVLDMAKDFLQEIERLGIKTTLFTWPDEYVEFIKQDEWLADRFVSFEYKGQDYQSIHSLMENNKELEIKYDYDNFIDPPKDHHPSLKCHEIMATHLIKHIESKL